ncbi:Myb-like DNA-binding domain-containing protein, related [Eimeria acervulina]|uniref:Myb-like DNA-binding domain-containing protein, related n=1 Tax=Eimeria acervulina TaxID=5801 RepID=U6GC26_EIMAC|nr:Myb-like DNA-binding domain-containing protein, related [Eimeria acervulina]CDI77685.1 Myb-like DNA-binding domain-containing protein, related [Eimeria acervulina]
MVSDSREANNCGDTPQEWLKRLTVKVEPNDTTSGSFQREASSTVASSSECYSSEFLRKEPERSEVRHKKEKKEKSFRKPPKDERILIPKEAPVYVPALAPSQLPFGASQVVRKGEESFSPNQLQFLSLAAPGATGLWRLHARSGLNYRKGPFTTEERLIIEEALEQYAQREGLSSVEEAVKSLSGGSGGRHNVGRFQVIARCLPERPFASVYGYIRRRITGAVKRGFWSEEETRQLLLLARRIPSSIRGRWVKIGAILNRRPADVCDRWRTLQPRLSQLEAQYLHAIEDQKTSAEGGSSSPAEEGVAAVAVADSSAAANDAAAAESGKSSLTEEQRRLLLQEVQQRTGEELPSFGIPWQRIQEEAFPTRSHSCLRHAYNLLVLPEELERRMQANPRPVVLRHVLRCLGRLLQQEQLPPGLRGVEWQDILPFVPASLQQSVVRDAAFGIMKDEGIALDAAVARLLQLHEQRLTSTRRKDAAKLLRGALPVYVQQSLEMEIMKRAQAKGWSPEKIKKKMRRKRRAAAAKELTRLKARLAEVKASPLNAPPRGCPRFLQDASAAGECSKYEATEEDEFLFAAAAAAAEGIDTATAALLATPFTDTRAIQLMDADEEKSIKQIKDAEEEEAEEEIEEEAAEEETAAAEEAEEEATAEEAAEEAEEEAAAEEKKRKRKKRKKAGLEQEEEQAAGEGLEEEEEELHAAEAAFKKKKKRKKEKEKKYDYYEMRSGEEEGSEGENSGCLVVLPVEKTEKKKKKRKKHKTEQTTEEEKEEEKEEEELKQETEAAEEEEQRITFTEKKKKKKKKKKDYDYCNKYSEGYSLET